MTKLDSNPRTIFVRKLRRVQGRRRLLASAGILALAAGLINVQQASAVSASPTSVCNNGSCTVTFAYTGDYYLWTVPAGIRALNFDVLGAQGGKTGGLGGEVTGTFSTIPTSLYVYVGQAGKQGSLSPGGFNGGGQAGSAKGDEGSGGGASDLRTSTLLDDRVVVAGGGGGTGGFTGGVGGVGGGLIATKGRDGQGLGGGGGTQLAGGSGGAGNIGTAGQSGVKGVGGSGGLGSYGGGSGGGGYFGGGGGGADNDGTGYDGGGGGGGSSFANLAQTSNVTHSAGVRTGNGSVILTYAYSPTVTSFTSASTVTSAATASFSLAFNQAVGGLDSTDLSLVTNATGCGISSITGSTTSYVVTVAGCSDGNVNLTLIADSVLGGTTGPIASVSSPTVTFDRKAPTITLTAPASPSNSASQVFTVSSDESLAALPTSALIASGDGCSVGAISGGGRSWQVALDGCASGASAGLSLKAAAVADGVGNLAPIVAIAAGPVTVDRQAPTLSNLSLDSASRPAMLIFDLNLSETVTDLTAADFVVGGTGCSLSKLTGSGGAYQVYLSDCAVGAHASVTLKSSAVLDSAGNRGPATDQLSGETVIDSDAPTVAFTAIDQANNLASPSFTMTFSEPVTGLALNSLIKDGSARGCSFALAELVAGLSYKVTASGCIPGTLRLTVPAGVVVDAAGNLGPLTATASKTVTIDKDQSTVNGGGAGGAGVKKLPKKVTKPATPKNGSAAGGKGKKSDGAKSSNHGKAASGSRAKGKTTGKHPGKGKSSGKLKPIASPAPTHQRATTASIVDIGDSGWWFAGLSGGSTSILVGSAVRKLRQWMHGNGKRKLLS